jgi:cytochrome c oxidase cbb3-type subunit I/II
MANRYCNYFHLGSHGINLIGTMIKRREFTCSHLVLPGYFVTVSFTYIQQLRVTVSWFSMKSYSVYAGVQDALVQWYGHNAVAFLQHLLGLMYYSKKAANRPVYSYRLSIVHFCP